MYHFKVINIRVRACVKCREYEVIHPSDPTNQNLLRLFDLKHRGHTVVTLDREEVKDTYAHFEGPNVEKNPKAST